MPGHGFVELPSELLSIPISKAVVMVTLLFSAAFVNPMANKDRVAAAFFRGFLLQALRWERQWVRSKGSLMRKDLPHPEWRTARMSFIGSNSAYESSDRIVSRHLLSTFFFISSVPSRKLFLVAKLALADLLVPVPASFVLLPPSFYFFFSCSCSLSSSSVSSGSR